MYVENNSFQTWMELIMKRFDSLTQKIDKQINPNNKLNNEALLDNQDLCLLLKVSKRTLQRLRSSGKLPYKRIGKKTYYLESDVYKFIQNGFNTNLK